MKSVEVVDGDLLDQEVDAIVNPWNRNLIPWWLLLPHGVSGAIRRGAGASPFRELGRYGGMRSGEAVVTSAGRLPHKAIIHVAGLTWRWTTNYEIVGECASQACQACLSRGFKSIALPLIGAGVGGLEPGGVLEVLKDSIAPFLDRLDARVVVYQKV